VELVQPLIVHDATSFHTFLGFISHTSYSIANHTQPYIKD
jgi:hypothetical protein